MGHAYEWCNEDESAMAEYEFALTLGGEDRVGLLRERYLLAESLGRSSDDLLSLLAPLIDEIGRASCRERV